MAPQTAKHMASLPLREATPLQIGYLGLVDCSMRGTRYEDHGMRTSLHDAPYHPHTMSVSQHIHVQALSAPDAYKLRHGCLSHEVMTSQKFPLVPWHLFLCHAACGCHGFGLRPSAKATSHAIPGWTPARRIPEVMPQSNPLR